MGEGVAGGGMGVDMGVGVTCLHMPTWELWAALD